MNARLLQYLHALDEALARQEAEKQAAQIDWGRAVQTLRPPESWLDDDDNPFESEEPGS
jgi:hypothetical protein